jgi:hypothetical protein
LSIVSNAGRLIPALCATDPLILVGLDDQPATVFGHLRQHEPLILSGLVVAANAQIDRSAIRMGMGGMCSRSKRRPH